MSKFDYASATIKSQAHVILFSADTTAAGVSESYLGASGVRSAIRTPEFVKIAANESPSLPRNLNLGTTLFDDGPLKVPTGGAREQIQAVKAKFLEVWQNGQVPICLGGDHLIKHAALDALLESEHEAIVLYVDAHPDIALNEAANYATVIHHALEREPKLVERLFLVALRQINEAEAEGLMFWKPQILWAQDFFTKSFDELYAPIAALKSRFKKVYLSVDLDGLDPSCAPAVEAPYPGGPQLAHILEMIQRVSKDFEIIGFDLSEFMPDLDSQRLTALTAAALITEVSSCLKN